jgi:hypothetical protein
LKEELSHNFDPVSQLEEQKKVKEEIMSQLHNKEEDCEKLEKENVSLIKEINVLIVELNNSKKFEQSSMSLDDMLNNQRSPFDITGLGYNPNPTLQRTKEENKSYDMDLINPIECNENTNEANPDQQNPVVLHRKNEFRKVMTPRRPTMNMYEYLFLGNYFSCNNFGHKEIDYGAYPRNDQRRNGGMYNALRNNYVNNKVKNLVDNRNKNSFSPLFNYNIECYKFHNFGHKSQD